MTMCLLLKGAALEGEGDKGIQDQEEAIEGGAPKPKDPGPASDLKQPREGAGAPQAAVAELHPVPQNQAQAGDKAADAPKLPVPVPYQEDVQAKPAAVAPGSESLKETELGARGVPLGQRGPDDHQPAVPQNGQLAPLQNQGIKSGVEDVRKKVQARLGKELEREPREQEPEKERTDKDMKEKEMQARLEKERKDELAREQELEKERAEKDQLPQGKAAKAMAEGRFQQEMQKADNEINQRARKQKELEETRGKQGQLDQAKNAAHGAAKEDGEALKKGGRDLKENVDAQADPRGARGEAIKAEARPQGSHEKVRDQGDTDLRRRRRAVGPTEGGGPPKQPKVSGGVPGLEPLLELGGSDLHVALEEQLLAGAMVHSRQIKQSLEAEREK